jgi:predicted 2-oxoglutarate/Fe(II)-dependent dioxygenase YbiX
VPALNGNPRYAFHTTAGRAILLLFVGSASWAESRAALAGIARARHRFDDDDLSFFGVTCDPQDVEQGRIVNAMPGIRWLLDFNLAVSRLYGFAGDAGRVTPGWMLLDCAHRIVMTGTLDRLEEVFTLSGALTASVPQGFSAPVLALPRVFDVDLCARLVEEYDRQGGQESGFMRDVDGKTVRQFDPSYKRRSDLLIDDPGLLAEIRQRVVAAIRPQLLKVFQFDGCHIERWLVARYEAANGGHFRAHRDNTTAGTAHRRFACTINLNQGEYRGGALRFPEFGHAAYDVPTGTALIFSCSLLHEVTPVEQGVRYAFLPFFYDAEAAKIRDRNLALVQDEAL